MNEEIEKWSAPDWLKAAIKRYPSKLDDIKKLHQYNATSHIIICGMASALLSDTKESRNAVKVPLFNNEVPNNALKWKDAAMSNDFPKIDSNTLDKKVNEGFLVGMHPGSFGLVVIDVDDGDYKKVIKKGGAPVCVLSTPSGGKHIVYKKPDDAPLIKNEMLSQYFDDVGGDVRGDCGYVILYQPWELSDALNDDNVNNNYISDEFLSEICGCEFNKRINAALKKGLGSDANLGQPETAFYDKDDGIKRFKNSKKGERNNTANAMIWRDAYYGELCDSQINKYIDAAKSNGMDRLEIIKVISKASDAATKQRQDHFTEHNVFPKRYPKGAKVSNKSSNLLFDKNNPKDRLRVLNEVVKLAQYNTRSDCSYYKYELDDEWIEYDDTSPTDIAVEIASRGYYWITRGKHETEYPADFSVIEIDKMMSSRFHKNQFDEIKDYFISLNDKWDGKDRIKNLMWRIFRCKKSDLLAKKTEILLVGIINRVMSPGCKFDYMFFIEGGQGIGKSTFLNYLFPKICRHNAVSSRINLRETEQKMMESAAGSVIMLFDEAFSKRQRERENLKSLITSQTITYRRPYARTPMNINASWVMVATTNSKDFIQNDPTGSRRFLVFECDPDNKLNPQSNGFDIESYFDKDDNRDQIFAQAMSMYRSGYRYSFDDVLAEALAKEREYHREKDFKYEDLINELIDSGILKDGQLYRVISYLAGFYTIRHGIGSDLDTKEMTDLLESGKDPSELNLVPHGSTMERNLMKDALLKNGFEIRKCQTDIEDDTGRFKVMNVIKKINTTN